MSWGRGSRPFSHVQSLPLVFHCNERRKEDRGQGYKFNQYYLEGWSGSFFLFMGILKSFLGKLAKFVRFTLTLNNDF